MPFDQWWFWIFVAVPLMALSIGMVEVLGKTIERLARVLCGESTGVKQLKRELSELKAQLGKTRSFQKLLEMQRQLSLQELRVIEQNALPEGVVVFLFTDIEGFTRFIDQHGDETVFDWLQQHNQLVRRCVHEHGGSEIKQLGDGFMFCFSSAKKALLCAAETQSQLDQLNEVSGSLLKVRMGLHAGEPIQDEKDFIGQTVNLTARILKQANGGQIFISEVVKNLAGPLKSFQYVDQGQRRLAGISQPQQLYEFYRIAALAHPLDSTVDRQLEALEERMKTDPPSSTS